MTDGGPGRARGAAASSTRCSPTRACRSTTRATWRSSRRARPSPRRCSTWSSAPRRSTAAAGWRARVRCTPRTRRCAGSPTWPACPSRPAAASSPGGTIGNLSALVAARYTYLAERGGERPAAAGASPPPTRPTRRSTRAAQVMDVDVLGCRPTQRGRLTGEALRPRSPSSGDDGLFAAVATAGTTNLGIVDDLAGVAEVCDRPRPVDARRRRLRRRRRWPRRRVRDRVPRASSAPTASSSTPTSGCSRRSTAARCCTGARSWPGPRTPSTPATSTPIQSEPEWNPSDYAVHLSRRARGLPFWFSLAVARHRRLLDRDRVARSR